VARVWALASELVAPAVRQAEESASPPAELAQQLVWLVELLL
jgi:hypothetical protein